MSEGFESCSASNSSRKSKGLSRLVALTNPTRKLFGMRSAEKSPNS